MIKTVLYPVKNLDAAKARFTALIGSAPVADSPYYVGWNLEDGQHVGLVPDSPTPGAAYWHVSDINSSLQGLVDAGSTVVQDPRDVGGGRLVALAEDPDGNVIGLVQDQA
ncbi:VOC family protein [Hamadaea tsunoensis]|uniref:VOC family protein n=1 Tax=Hamadaea tsunoensis TaxID=53368 RepID=UPI0004250041|nr:VOC family protein [Hamadaea tsunoensis]